MSLLLERRGTDAGTEIKTWFPEFVVLTTPNPVTDICIEDFLSACEYVLMNTDLIPDDPRLQFVEKISKMKPIDGWGEGKQRLGYPDPDRLEMNL